MADNKKIYEEDIITMVGEDGTEIDFVELGDIVYGDNYYIIVDTVENFESGEELAPVVFKVEQDGEDTKYTVELNDEIIDGVFAEFNRLLDEAEDDE